MKTRPRVLVVEDDKTYRETLLDILNVGEYVAVGAGTAAEALSAIDRVSFAVAIIDIMLAGDDTSNRDGIAVLAYLHTLGETTRSLVLSGQESRPLVRDVLTEYGAVDYIDKEQLAGRDNEFLLQKVKMALGTGVSSSGSADWQKLAKILRGDLTEDQFVYECLQTLGLKGGFANLSASLLNATRYFAPLLQEEGTRGGVSRQRAPQVFSGRFWSKGHGTAVEILLHGLRASEVLESEWKLSDRTVLYNRTKGGLSVVVLASPELEREQFLPAPS